MSESDQSPRFVRLDLSRKTERIERTLPILIGSIPPQIPTYGELPPLPKQAPDEGVCKLTVSGAKVDAEVRKTRLQVFLQKLSGATDEKLSAEWALQAVPVAVFATGADRAALREAIATAADASWEADGTGKLLVAKPSKKPNAERPPGPGDLLRKLFWVTSLDDAERQMAYACDRRLFGQSTPISFVASAIRLLQLTDPAAPEHADKPGELRLKAAWLSEEAMGNLMRVSQRLKWDETMQPVYDRTVLEDPRTTIKFTWDGKGNYHLDVRNPSLENLDALTCNFGLDVMQYDSDFVLAHFSEQPWFLKFPTDAPKDYLEYLERTRAWRGKLALKHIAPLAFIPEAKWLGIRKKVPEFEAVTPANRRAMHLYAVLDHALRQKSCGDGMKIQQQREVWTINWLARAVVSAANIKFTTWGKDDKLRLVTESGVVQAVEFSSAGRTLRFAVPKADELLGKEGCLPAP
jgi:hypothetical protein